MKLYIKNYNPLDIFKKINLLDEYYFNTKNSIEIFSDDGIFYIDNKRFYKINVILDDLDELRNNDLKLLLDKSVYKNQTINQLPLNHIVNNLTTFFYAKNQKSKIKLIIEGNYDLDNNKLVNNKNIPNKYQNFNPTNFYFDVPNEMANFELLNNDDLNVFLSMLN